MPSPIFPWYTQVQTLFSVTYKVRKSLFELRLVKLIICMALGTLDSNGVMCLIDPQGHTYEAYCSCSRVGRWLFFRASRVDNNICEYWDKGKPRIEAFLAEHLKACSGNWVCNGLQLLAALVQPRPLRNTLGKNHVWIISLNPSRRLSEFCTFFAVDRANWLKCRGLLSSVSPNHALPFRWCTSLWYTNISFIFSIATVGSCQQIIMSLVGIIVGFHIMYPAPPFFSCLLPTSEVGYSTLSLTLSCALPILSYYPLKKMSSPNRENDRGTEQPTAADIGLVDSMFMSFICLSLTH